MGPITRFRAEIERGLGKSIAKPLSAFLDNHMGPVFEESFRDHLRRLANQGDLGEDIVAVGSWWGEDSQNQIDAVVLAQHGLTRVPVLVGESKWTSTVNAGRLTAGLARKAAVLAPDTEGLRYAVCARDTVEHADDSTLTITARDIFDT